VVPDSQEGRERITRLEERVESNRRQIEVFGPLPLEVALIRKAQEDARDDLRELMKEVDERFDREREDRREWQKEFVRDIGQRIGTCAAEIGRLSAAFEEDRKAQRQTKVQEWTTRYGARVAIAAVLISSLTSIGIALFGGN